MASEAMDAGESATGQSMSTLLEQREVWGIAIVLARSHGTDAVPVARDRALKAVQEDDRSGFAIWEAVGEALEQLLKPAPDHGEWRH